MEQAPSASVFSYSLKSLNKGIDNSKDDSFGDGLEIIN